MEETCGVSEEEIIMEEIWKDSSVQNYEVSNLGRIRNKKTLHVLALDKEEKGYRRLSLKIKGVKKHFAVHRLVAIAFIPNPEHKPQIDHIDGDKSNNCISNLRWVTNYENNCKENKYKQGGPR